MTGQINITNRQLENAKLYHLTRAQEEAKKARDAGNPRVRSSHEGLSALHAEACQQLEGIKMLRAEVRDRIG